MPRNLPANVRKNIDKIISEPIYLMEINLDGVDYRYSTSKLKAGGFISDGRIIELPNFTEALGLDAQEVQIKLAYNNIWTDVDGNERTINITDPKIYRGRTVKFYLGYEKDYEYTWLDATNPARLTTTNYYPEANNLRENTTGWTFDYDPSFVYLNSIDGDNISLVNATLDSDTLNGFSYKIEGFNATQGYAAYNIELLSATNYETIDELSRYHKEFTFTGSGGTTHAIDRLRIYPNNKMKLGSDLVSDSTFNNTSDWSKTDNADSQVNINVGFVEFVLNDDNTSAITLEPASSFNLVSGKQYKVDYTILETDPGDDTLEILSTLAGPDGTALSNTEGTYSYTFTAASALPFKITGTPAASIPGTGRELIKISSIQIREEDAVENPYVDIDVTGVQLSGDENYRFSFHANSSLFGGLNITKTSRLVDFNYGSTIPLKRPEEHSLKIFEGIIGDVSSEVGQESFYTLHIESVLLQLNVNKVSRYSNQEQQDRYSGDKGLEFSRVTQQSLFVQRNEIAPDNLPARKIIYGQTKVDGDCVFAAITGDNGEFMNMVFAFADHEIESYEQFYLDDVNVYEPGTKTISTNFFVGSTQLVTVYEHLGTTTQTVDTNLQSEVGSDTWTSNHRLRGISYIYIQCRYNSDVFGDMIPKVSAEIKGKKVLDTRTSTTSYSNNPALCLRDFILDTNYGLGTATFNNDTVNSVANVCEETKLVATKSGSDLVTNGDFSSGTDWTLTGADVTISGGKLNFVHTSGNTPLPSATQSGILTADTKYYITYTVDSNTQTERSILTDGNGFVWNTTPGTHKVIYTAHDTDLTFTISTELNETFSYGVVFDDISVFAAAFATEDNFEFNGSLTTEDLPSYNIKEILKSFGGQISYASGEFNIFGPVLKESSLSLDTGNIYSDVSSSNKNYSEVFNTVNGQFKNPEILYKADNYPTYNFENPEESDTRELNLDLLNTTSSNMCQRLGRIALYKSRDTQILALSCGLKAIKLLAGDTVNIATNQDSIDGLYQIVSIELNVKEALVNLVLIKENINTYEFDETDYQEKAETTTLPDSNILTWVNAKIPKPSFDRGSGNFTVAFDLTINYDSTTAADIFFTTDGSLPVSDGSGTSTSYSAPFEISDTVDGNITTVKAKAFETSGSLVSDVAQVSFTFIAPTVLINAPTQRILRPLEINGTADMTSPKLRWQIPAQPSGATTGLTLHYSIDGGNYYYAVTGKSVGSTVDLTLSPGYNPELYKAYISKSGYITSSVQNADNKPFIAGKSRTGGYSATDRFDRTWYWDHSIDIYCYGPAGKLYIENTSTNFSNLSNPKTVSQWAQKVSWTNTSYSSRVFSIAYEGATRTVLAYIECPDGRISDTVRFRGYHGGQNNITGLTGYYYWNLRYFTEEVLV